MPQFNRKPILFQHIVVMVVALLLSAPSGRAQWATNYHPLPSTSVQLDSLQKVLETAKAERLRPISPTREKTRHQIVSEHHQVLIDKLSEGHILWHPGIYAYLQNILKEIARHNQGLGIEQVRILLARYPSPNATAWGEGTMVLNIGLMPILENENQLAFVICHELSHQLLAHTDKSILRKVALLESKSVKDELRNIAQTEYGARARALAFLKTVQYDQTRHSRVAEAQADSMAMVLLLPTRYDAREALACLSILDHCDEPDSSTLGLDQLFDSPAFPFQAKWLKIEDSGFSYGDVQSEFDQDSLKTHPDCQERIVQLVPHLSNYPEPSAASPAKNVEAFGFLRTTAMFELGAAHMWGQDVGKALYAGIRLLQRYPENAYAKGFIGICLNRIYRAQKDHEQGRWLEMPHAAFPKQYNLLLNFIQNIRISELLQVTHHYLNARIGDLSSEQLLYAWWENAMLRGDTDAQQQARDRYHSLFPNGIYQQQITD